MPKFVIKDGGPGSGPQPGGAKKAPMQSSYGSGDPSPGFVAQHSAASHTQEAKRHEDRAKLHAQPRAGESKGQSESRMAEHLRSKKLAQQHHRASQIAAKTVGFNKDSRSGKTALAGDSKEVLMPQVRLSPQATVAKGALMVYLGPRMAQDAAIDLHGTLKGVKGRNFRAEAKRVAVDIQKALKGKLAQDADVNDISDILEEIAEALESEGSVPAEGGEDDFVDKDAEPYGMTGEGSDNDDDTPDVIAQIKEFLAGKISPEDQAELDRVISSASSGGNGGEDGEEGESEEEKAAREEKMRQEEEMRGRDQRARDRRARDGRGGAADEPPPFKGRPTPGGTMDKKAMDAAIRGERQLQRDISTAERYVRPWVGDFAMDEANSPHDVYGAALKMLGTDTDDIHPSAFRAILDRTPKPGDRLRGNGSGSRFAQDAKSTSKSFAERFPNASRIGTV